MKKCNSKHICFPGYVLSSVTMRTISSLFGQKAINVSPLGGHSWPTCFNHCPFLDCFQGISTFPGSLEVSAKRDEGDNLSAVPVHMLCYKAEPASWCEPCITPGPSALGLMFCHNCLEILYNFFNKEAHFLVFTGPCKCHSWPRIRQTAPHTGPDDTPMFIHLQLCQPKAPTQGSNTQCSSLSIDQEGILHTQPVKWKLAEEGNRCPRTAPSPRCLEDPELPGGHLNFHFDFSHVDTHSIWE